MLEAERHFRKVAGYRALLKLVRHQAVVPIVNPPFAIYRAIMRS